MHAHHTHAWQHACTNTLTPAHAYKENCTEASDVNGSIDIDIHYCITMFIDSLLSV